MYISRGIITKTLLQLFHAVFTKCHHIKICWDEPWAEKCWGGDSNLPLRLHCYNRYGALETFITGRELWAKSVILFWFANEILSMTEIVFLFFNNKSATYSIISQTSLEPSRAFFYAIWSCLYFMLHYYLHVK